MVVDLGREHSRFVDGLLNSRRVVTVPSAPKTGPYQDGEWNDGGNHQGQKARLNAPQQHRLPLCPAARSFADLTARRNCLAKHSSARVAKAAKSLIFLITMNDGLTSLPFGAGTDGPWPSLELALEVCTATRRSGGAWR